MPITLAQAKSLSQDKLTDDIIDEFSESNFIKDLPFDNTVKAQGGKSLTYTYNRLTTLPEAGTRAINGVYTAQEAAATPESVDLKIMGGAYKIDRAIQNNETQLVDHVEMQSIQKTKATRAVFHNLSINGDSAVDIEEFDGLDKVLTGSTTEVVPDTAIDLSDADKIKANANAFLYYIRQTIKQMNGAPTKFLMNSDLWAVFQSVADTVTSVKFTRDELGNEIGHYGKAMFQEMGDKPGTSEQIISTDETTGKTDLYMVILGLEDVHGVSPEGNKVITPYLPDFKTPGPVKEGEVEFIGAIAIKKTKSAAVLRGIKVK